MRPMIAGRWCFVRHWCARGGAGISILAAGALLTSRAEAQAPPAPLAETAPEPVPAPAPEPVPALAPAPALVPVPAPASAPPEAARPAKIEIDEYMAEAYENDTETRSRAIKQQRRVL